MSATIEAVRPAPAPPTVSDPVLEVTGVPAVEILRRCAEVRQGGGQDLSLLNAAARERRQVWRLVDFGDGTDIDFVEAVHLVLLGRLPTEGELERRTGQLALGRSRFELIARLALCPEGRQRAQPPVTGLGLPALVALGHGFERAERTRHLGAAIHLGETAARAVARARGAGGRGSRLVRTGAAVAGSAAVLRHVVSLRSEVGDLRDQLAELRDGLRT